jgi:hypothetical protein
MGAEGRRGARVDVFAVLGDEGLHFVC